MLPREPKVGMRIPVKNLSEKLFGCELPCRGVVRDGRHYPRSILYLGNNAPRLIVIGKNPGHMLAGEPRAETYEDWVQWTRECFTQIDDKSTKFHINLLRYLNFLLSSGYLEYREAKPRSVRTELFESVFTRVYMTNMLKCSTPDERETFGNLNTELDNCTKTYLDKELSLCGHPPVLCLGGEAIQSFGKYFPKYANKVTHLRHPSYFYATKNNTTKAKLLEAKEALGL